MANYPQGVTEFIPDYQAYQPDFNFTANVLQLKQTQYDQNWQKLNNIYGQILHAPLTHDESIRRRDNTFNRIDFDLKRITGLDLSLDQNVQQATQLFRPFYEDASLMKDMAFTKNASYEKSFGEGKRYSTDEASSSEYWGDGIRALDYKIQEFKDTPYDQLPGFQDVKYTPYVNVEMKAMELAKKMNYTIDKTTPNGPWIIREQNGDQIIAPLQSIFYAALGEDPKIQELYATQAYLKRKDYIYSNKDNPEFKGDAVLAEKQYLNDALNVMKEQTLLNRGQIIDEKIANQNVINELEKSLKDGDGDETTQASLERYKQANQDLDKMLGQVDKDLSLVSDNINKTATTTGGSTLSMDDMDNMRFRIDNVVGSNLMQADLNRAAKEFSTMNYKFDIEANPYEVQKQKYNYDSALINQRANAQMAVAQFKENLTQAKELKAKMLKSGLYDEDPITGEVKMKPELANIQKATSAIAKSKGLDPQDLQKKIAKMYSEDASKAKQYVFSTLKGLKEAGFLSNKAIMDILDEDVYSGFDMNTVMEWLDSSKGGRKKDSYSQNKVLELAGMKPKAKTGKLPNKVKKALMRQGLYATTVEKEEAERSGDQVLSQYADAALTEFNSRSIKDAAPGYISRLANQTIAQLEKLKDIPYLKNNQSINDLTAVSWYLNDYAANQKAIDKRKADLKQDVVNKMKQHGFNYAEYMFDGQNNYIGDNKELFIRNAMLHAPNDVQHTTFSFQDYLDKIIQSTTVGSMGGSAIPIVGTGAGAVIGFATGVLGYPIIRGGQTAAAEIYDAFNDDFWDDYSNEITFKNGYQGPIVGHLNVDQELEEMTELYRDFIDQGDILPNPVGIFGGQSTGTYTMAGGRMTIDPGVVSPTYQTFQELNRVIKDINIDADDTAYISLQGIDDKAVKDDMYQATLDANKSVWKMIYKDVMDKMRKKDSKLGRVHVDFSPIAGEDANLAGVTFNLSPEYLAQYKPKKGEKGVLTSDMYNDLVTNGLSIILDADKLAHTTLYKHSFMTPEQVTIQNAGAKGVTYKHPMYSDYSINFKMVGDNAVEVSQTYPIYNGPGQKDLKHTTRDIMSLQTLNVQYARNKFFTESVISNDHANSQLRKGNGRQ